MPSSMTCYGVGKSRTRGCRHSTSGFVLTGFVITRATSPSSMTLRGRRRPLVEVAPALRSRALSESVVDQHVALGLGLGAIDVGAAIGIEIAAGTGRQSLRRERAGRARGRP